MLHLLAGAFGLIGSGGLSHILSPNAAPLRAPPAGLAGDRTMEDALLARLAQGRHDLGGLVRLAGGDHARILALLGRLEASGKVRRLPGMRFEISGTRA